MVPLRWLSQHPRLLLQPSLVFAVTLALGYLARRLCLRGLGAFVRRTNSRAGSILNDALRPASTFWIVILAVHLAIESSELPRVVTGVWGPHILIALWIASFTFMLMRVASNLVRHYGSQNPGAMPVTTLTETLAQLAVLILGILLVFSAENLQIAPILTALGVGGLAVALALQDTLSNLFAGFYMAVAGQVRLGDYLKLNTGEEGYVADITWRSTTFRTLGQNLIIVPNAKLAQAIVTNYHLPEKRMSASLQVNVDPDSDPDFVQQVLLEVALGAVNDLPGMLADPKPSVSIDPGPGEWALTFSVGFYVAEFSDQYTVRPELRKRILRRLRQEGIRIPFPTRTLHIVPPTP
jgi:small-conductance mechanosensitive channel